MKHPFCWSSSIVFVVYFHCYCSSLMRKFRLFRHFLVAHKYRPIWKWKSDLTYTINIHSYILYTTPLKFGPPFMVDESSRGTILGSIIWCGPKIQGANFSLKPHLKNFPHKNNKQAGIRYSPAHHLPSSLHTYPTGNDNNLLEMTKFPEVFYWGLRYSDKINAPLNVQEILATEHI